VEQNMSRVHSGATVLISTTELASALQAADLVLIDCRYTLGEPDRGLAAWRSGHIPGARYVDLERDLSDPVRPGSGRHPLPDAGRLEELFSRLGIGSGSRIVAYDDAGGAIAGRLWWLLKWLGHEQVQVLDGGLPAWTAAGLPLVTDSPPATAAVFRARPGHMPVVSTTELLADQGHYLIIDVRAPRRYRGEEEPLDRVAGHIPGAINLPFSASLMADGRFRPAAELREHFVRAMGSHRPENTVCMCGSGVTACHALLAMAHAGLPGARLYPGSWSEWISDPARPVATGGIA